jgi:hypothetical protein
MGNVTNDATHSYTWDAEGRLLNVDNGATAQYAYDVYGRRVHLLQPGIVSLDYVFDQRGHAIAAFSGAGS